MKQLFIIIYLFISSQGFAQFNADSLFQQAREAAYSKDYKTARSICKKILQKDSYPDANVLIGRTFSWSKQYDSARYYLKKVTTEKFDHKDARIALIDTELWSANYESAAKESEIGISFFPDDSDFMIRKAKALEKLDENYEAIRVLKRILKTEPDNEQAKQLLESIREKMKIHKIDFAHSFDFHKDPWRRRFHISSFGFARKEKFASMMARVNVGDLVKDGETLFGNETGIQFEFDAYPKIRKGTYAYVSYGYAPKLIFPRHRAGFELFQSLPFSFEASVGFRYMQFVKSDDSRKNVIVYTGSVGKYWSNYWFSARPFISVKSVGLSQSWFFTVRRYLKTADDFIFMILGYGNSPDEVTNNFNDIDLYKLKSRKVKIGLEHKLTKNFSGKLSLGYEQEEYKSASYRNVYNGSMSLSYRF